MGMITAIIPLLLIKGSPLLDVLVTTFLATKIILPLIRNGGTIALNWGQVNNIRRTRQHLPLPITKVRISPIHPRLIILILMHQEIIGRSQHWVPLVYRPLTSRNYKHKLVWKIKVVKSARTLWISFQRQLISFELAKLRKVRR